MWPLPKPSIGCQIVSGIAPSHEAAHRRAPSEYARVIRPQLRRGARTMLGYLRRKGRILYIWRTRYCRVSTVSGGPYAEAIRVTSGGDEDWPGPDVLIWGERGRGAPQVAAMCDGRLRKAVIDTPGTDIACRGLEADVDDPAVRAVAEDEYRHAIEEARQLLRRIRGR
ncbi:hypothetical protein DL767_005198 [Monosporascus sp. MG133]|nr:hypothetical protein DL767_005198 [Monosporascus sp. MG133]